MRPAESLFLDIRGLKYHVRHWNASPGAAGLLRRVVLLHGWMDVSASFQFLVDALGDRWEVLAPDWRGYGLSDWGRSDCYWFPDYLADLDALLAQLQPDAPVDLVGHSLGGNVAALYAGVRPQRIARLVNLEGFGMQRTQSDQAPQRYAAWLDELRDPPRLKSYAGFPELAERLQKNNPRLRRDRAEFLAQHWGRPGDDGRVVLRGDPAHKVIYPMLYRFEEARACWQSITAPVLWVDAADSELAQRMRLSAEDYAERRDAYRRLRCATVQDAGHMLHHDQPERVAGLIEAFLQDPAP
jgi:pimeloyl-ACP methyl ester carboxylesterase